MKRFVFAAVLLGAALAVSVVRAQNPSPLPTMTVVRDPGCGCCLGWVAHMRKAGFNGTVTESADRIRNTPGVPTDARSCHTATIGGYLIEGHVPVEDVKRLLKERPAGVIGIAAPGMPVGSPGMETPSGTVTPYNVIAFDKSGKTSVFSSHK